MPELRALPSSPPSWPPHLYVGMRMYIFPSDCVCAPEMEKQLIIPNVSQQMGCWWMHYDVSARETQHQMRGRRIYYCWGVKNSLAGGAYMRRALALGDEMRIVFAVLFMAHRLVGNCQVGEFS